MNRNLLKAAHREARIIQALVDLEIEHGTRIETNDYAASLALGYEQVSKRAALPTVPAPKVIVQTVYRTTAAPGSKPAIPRPKHMNGRDMWGRPV